MKLDREVIIGILICGLVLFGWQPLMKYMGWSAPAAQERVQANNSATTPQAPTSNVNAVTPSSTPATTLPTTAQLKRYPNQLLENEKIAIDIDPNTGSISTITLKEYLTADRKENVKLDQRPTTTQNLGSLQPGALSIFSSKSQWTLKGIIAQNLSTDKRTFTLTRQMQNGENIFLVTQRWTLDDNYKTNLEISITNANNTPIILSDVVVSAGEIEQWALVSGDKMRIDNLQLDYYTAGGKFEKISGTADDEDFFGAVSSQISWVALNNKYFASILKGNTAGTLFRARGYKMIKDGKSYLISSGLFLNTITVTKEIPVILNFEYYSGPKIVKDLSLFTPEASQIVHLAWGPLNYLAKFLLWALVSLHGILGSYGWSIIILTFFVRLIFYPITAKANSSMKRMASVQPKIQALREQYKDNPQILNSKMMELYREEKVNPFGGCLPILLQIPVFFALYETLNGAVELRQVPFLWSSDLATPDTIAVVFGLPINPLVIAMTLLMILQQNLTPSAMEPSQRKMMLAMPLIMLFFLYDLPSGLTLYWTVSQIFSILQLLIQQKFTNKSALTVKASPKR